MKIKQVVMDGPNQVELKNLEVELRPGAGELLIQTEASYISAGTELSIYTGRESDVFKPGAWCQYPFKAGYANVGRVLEAGAESGFAAGDRVFSCGPHASHFKVRPASSMVVKVPAAIASDVAVASRMAGVSNASLLQADRVWNPWVAVFGLGNVGNLAAQGFRILGGKVIGIDPVAKRREIAGRCGIRHCLEAGTPEAIKAITGGELADLVVDASGYTPVILQALAATANQGQLILLGSPRTPHEGNLTALVQEIHLRNLTVKGALEWFQPLHPVKSIFGGRTQQLFSLEEKQKMIFDWIEAGSLHLEPLISHRLSPAEAKRGYEGLLREPAEFIGVVFDWTRC